MNLSPLHPACNIPERITSASISELIGELSAVPRAPMTTAGQFLQRRYHVNPILADLLAQIAGLGNEQVRR